MYALVSMVLLAMFLKKYADFAMLSLTYYFARYFLSRDMNQIRQALASVIVLYGYHNVQKVFLKRCHETNYHPQLLLLNYQGCQVHCVEEKLRLRVVILTRSFQSR